MATTTDVERVFREEYGRAVSVLVGRFGDLDLAEDAVQEAFAVAASRWTTEGIPPSPAGWVITTARNRIVDRLRRETSREDRHAQFLLVHQPDDADAGVDVSIEDDRLRLIFTCCHPALAPASQVALTLRLLGGLSTPEIARAFMVPEATLSQRIVRAKAKIRDAGVPYRVPSSAELPDRLRPVLSVVYLVFNEGYAASSGDALVRPDLCAEALRLGRTLAELMPDEPEVIGLLALMLLIAARQPARTRRDGSLVPLAEQDRSLWDGALVAEGQHLVRWCLAHNAPGPYQVQAAINAVHSDASGTDETDWHQILALYDRLLILDPSPVVRLNRAVALAEVDGPEAALSEVETLDLASYYPFHAVRADLLRRTGRLPEAVEAYDQARALTGNASERAFLTQAMKDLSSS